MTVLPLDERATLFALFATRVTEPVKTLLSWEYLQAATADAGVRVERRRPNPDATQAEHYVRLTSDGARRSAAYLVFGAATVELTLPHDQGDEFDGIPGVTFPTTDGRPERVFVHLADDARCPEIALTLTRRALAHAVASAN